MDFRPSRRPLFVAQRRRGFFAKLGKRRLNRGVFRCVINLQSTINRFVRGDNHDPKPVTWTADSDKIMATVSRFVHSIHLKFDSFMSGLPDAYRRSRSQRISGRNCLGGSNYRRVSMISSRKASNVGEARLSCALRELFLPLSVAVQYLIGVRSCGS